MKCYQITCLTALLLGAGMAGALPNDSGDIEVPELGRQWTRLDYYGQDLNGDGKIDENEWTVVRTLGTGPKAPEPPARQLAEGESHRWETLKETYFLNRPSEKIRLIQPALGNRAVSPARPRD